MLLFVIYYFISKLGSLKALHLVSVICASYTEVKLFFTNLEIFDMFLNYFFFLNLGILNHYRCLIKVYDTYVEFYPFLNFSPRERQMFKF